MTDTAPEAGEAGVELGDNSHENGSKLAEAAEHMLLDLGKFADSQPDVEVCENCFWTMIAAIAVIQASAHNKGGVPSTLITVAKVARAMVEGNTKTTCH